MGDNIEMNIDIPVGDDGLVGRVCPTCDEFFKIKPGTGLPDINTTACPYCEYQGDPGEFTTQEQIDYAISVMAKEVVEPVLRDFQRSLKRIERRSQNSLIKIKVRTSSMTIPIKYYSEPVLETSVECDHCGLVFSVYGIFARCPDCLRPNSMEMFRKSIEVAKKRLDIFEQIPESEEELREALLIDAISAAVSTFDSLGKRMRAEYPEIIPSQPRNIFQNITALENALQEALGLELINLIGEEDYRVLVYMFQVRHIWNHNFGEADQDFIDKTNVDENLLGQRILPAKTEVEKLMSIVEDIGIMVRKELGDNA